MDVENEKFENMMERFRVSLKKNIWYRTKIINLELSNLCNYTLIHPQCPTSKMKDRYVMPLEDIELISKKIGDAGYDRLLCPYLYSEPLIDPRLYVVLDILKKNVPKAKLGFISNGFFLYETILDNVVEKGVRHLQTTAYFPDEYERLKKLKEKVSQKYPYLLFRVIKGFPLHKRMCDKFSIYEDIELNTSGMVCRAPYRTIQIDRYGSVCLCCNDWKNMVTFGNLKEQSIEEILLSDKMMSMHLNLLLGNRLKYDVCSRCFRRK